MMEEDRVGWVERSDTHQSVPIMLSSFSAA